MVRNNKNTSTEDLLQINNLVICKIDPETGNKSKLVHEINISLSRGEIVAIVGESGSGKTLTALSTVGLLPKPGIFVDAGEIIFEGRDIAHLTEPEYRKIRGKKIGVVFQEPLSALNPLHVIEKQIAECVQTHGNLTKAQIKNKVESLLEKVGLAKIIGRGGNYPFRLSGGERQRVMIAMAIANNPDVLILDEPTTALDATIRVAILDLLMQLKHEFNLGIILISHDLATVRRMADRAYVMREGVVVESGETEIVLNKPSHKYTIGLINAEKCGEPVQFENKDSAVSLVVDDLSVRYPIKRGILQRVAGYVDAALNVNFNLRQGESLGIVGESGSGKSSLAFALMRLVNYEGNVQVLGENLASLEKNSLRGFRKHIQIVFQDPFSSLNPRMTVKNIILEGFLIHNRRDITKQTLDSKIVEVLKEVGLKPEFAERYPHELSGGQRQRVSIARSLILRPEVLVMDEPTSALDLVTQSNVIELLKGLQKKYGMTYVFISHDLKVVRSICHKLIVMRNGMVVEQGDANSVFRNPQNDYTRNLIKSSVEL